MARRNAHARTKHGGDDPQQYIDFGYIPSYTALFIFIAILQWRSDRRWIAVLGPVSIVLILVVAGFDVAENLAILGVTERHNPAAWASTLPFLVSMLAMPPFLWLGSRGK